MLNGLPWDLVYQEWWGEYPPHDRTEYVGLYRDVAYRWHLVMLSLHLESLLAFLLLMSLVVPRLPK